MITSSRFRKVLCAFFGWYMLVFVSVGSPATPNTSSLTRQEWHERLQWDIDDCPLVFAEGTDGSGVSVTAMDASVALVTVECQRWAYQGTLRYYLQTGETIRPLDFEQFESPDKDSLERYRSPLVTGVPLMNAPRGMIDILRKYRGAGDCGQFLRYSINDANAVLKVLRVRECRTQGAGRVPPPQRWPVRKLPK